MEDCRHRRFIERVLTARERHCYVRHGATAMLLWSFWAAKETAYKTMQKHHGDISSVPRRYDVRLHHIPDVNALHPQVARGVVITPCDPVFITIIARRGFIHCVGVSSDEMHLDSLITGIGRISDGNSSSQVVRELARQRLSSVLENDPHCIEIVRSKGKKGLTPPVVFIGGHRSAIDVSLSHDGQYAAYAILHQ
jgi:phosphopantetheinyl transferase (holo-ACP synthase)